MIDGGGERDIQLRPTIPVHLTYQTAFVDDDGQLQFRDDVYGRDSRLLALSRATTAGSPTRRSSVAKTPRIVRFWRSRIPTPLFGGRGNGSYGGPGDGGNFFSRLFGGGFAATPPAPVRHAAPHRRETGSGAPVQR